MGCGQAPTLWKQPFSTLHIPEPRRCSRHYPRRYDSHPATLSRFPERRTALKWGSAIGFTHWLFPLVGFICGWYAAINSPLSTIVYLIGAIVMTWLVSEIVKDVSGLSNEDDDGPEASVWSSRKQFRAAVWAVSLARSSPALARPQQPQAGQRSKYGFPSQSSFSFSLCSRLISQEYYRQVRGFQCCISGRPAGQPGPEHQRSQKTWDILHCMHMVRDTYLQLFWTVSFDSDRAGGRHSSFHSHRAGWISPIHASSQ